MSGLSDVFYVLFSCSNLGRLEMPAPSRLPPNHRFSPVAVAERLMPPDRRRGRGAATNVSGRFEILSRQDFDDGWTRDEAPEPLQTEVTWETPKHVITRNNSPDIGFDRSINPYRGCEHGCFYCFARPTHAYMGLSPGLDFESRLFAKQGAPALLEKELASAKYSPAPIAFGTNTDPYQPIERQYRITRSLFEVLHKARHPISIVTKSNLILRDLDILSDMARDNLVKVFLSVTTLDRSAGPQDGAARADAREAHRGHREAERGRRSDRGDGRAHHSSGQ